MKQQLFNILMGLVGQLVYTEKLILSESQKEEIMNLDNWTFEGSSSAIIILNEMLYLFSYDKFFLQVQFTVKNDVVIKFDVITNEDKKIVYGK